MVEQKSNMLNQHEQELANAKSRAKQSCEIISDCEHQIAAIDQQIENSPDLKAQNKLRETYLEIKSRLQGENAQIERQTCKLDNEISHALQK